MSPRGQPSIDEVSRLDREAFVAAVGSACENSPWMIERFGPSAAA
jgi:2-oxo-4-hydroxy-4-carboxy--5-ureidoimidazoline (OHCU) decarboxylase